MSGFFSLLASNLVLRVVTSLLRTYCFRSTRSTEDKGELCQQSFQNPSTPPCLRSLYSPCFAEGHSESDNQSSNVPSSHFKLPHKSLRLCVSAGKNNIRMNITCSSLLISKTPENHTTCAPSSESNLSIEIKSLDLKLLSLLGDLEIRRLGGVYCGETTKCAKSHEKSFCVAGTFNVYRIIVYRLSRV